MMRPQVAPVIKSEAQRYVVFLKQAAMVGIHGGDERPNRVQVRDTTWPICSSLLGKLVLSRLGRCCDPSRRHLHESKRRAVGHTAFARTAM